MCAQNYPLYIKTIPTDNELKFYYTVHTSLDVVEEKVSSVGKNTNDLRELYLGLLYPTEDYKVYPSERKMLLFVCLGVKKSLARDPWLVGGLCLTSHRQLGHLETAPPFTLPCEGCEAWFLHRPHL